MKKLKSLIILTLCFCILCGLVDISKDEDPEAIQTLTAQYDKTEGWITSPGIVKKFEARDKDKSFQVNYREENIPSYTLPDALVMNDGSKVTNAKTWRNRHRLEILELFRTHVYGREPIGRPGGMKFELSSVNRETIEGKATQKNLAVNFTGKSTGPRMDMRVYTPNGATKPVPCFLYLGRDLKTDSARAERWGDVLPEILSRGYALAVIDRAGIDPDDYDEFKNGVHGAFEIDSYQTSFPVLYRFSHL